MYCPSDNKLFSNKHSETKKTIFAEGVAQTKRKPKSNCVKAQLQRCVKEVVRDLKIC